MKNMRNRALRVDSLWDDGVGSTSTTQLSRQQTSFQSMPSKHADSTGKAGGLRNVGASMLLLPLDDVHKPTILDEENSTVKYVPAEHASRGSRMATTQIDRLEMNKLPEVNKKVLLVRTTSDQHFKEVARSEDEFVSTRVAKGLVPDVVAEVPAPRKRLKDYFMTMAMRNTSKKMAGKSNASKKKKRGTLDQVVGVDRSVSEEVLCVPPAPPPRIVRCDSQGASPASSTPSTPKSGSTSSLHHRRISAPVLPTATIDFVERLRRRRDMDDTSMGLDYSVSDSVMPNTDEAAPAKHKPLVVTHNKEGAVSTHSVPTKNKSFQTQARQTRFDDAPDAVAAFNRPYSMEPHSGYSSYHAQRHQSVSSIHGMEGCWVEDDAS